MNGVTIQVRPCSVERCDGFAEKRGWCGKHYRRWQRHGDVHITARVFLSFERPSELINHLFSKRQIDDRGCWIWTGFKRRYGSMQIDGRNYAVHRVSAHVFRGLPIDSPLGVLHHCDVPRCFNPDHFFFGTQEDNVQDMFAKGRDNHSRGETVNTARLTETDVRIVRKRHFEGESASAISREYGVSSSTIYSIVHRRTWKHVD